MNIKHILFPVDFSDCSRALNPEVKWAANHFGSDVTLMHVFEIPCTWYGTGEAPLINAECFQQFADDVKKRLQEYPLDIPSNRISRVIAEGDASWCIKKWIDEHDVDLIMMGTHGYGSFRRTLLGSVAMKLLHDVSCPVWTHSHTQVDSFAASGISNILCALDLTEETVPLLRFVSDFAHDCGAAVHIVHAVPEIESRPYRYLDMDLHKYLKKCAAKNIEESQQDAGTDFSVTITDGFIANDAAALATEQGTDLVVIGRGKTQDVFGKLRTHSYEIVRQAPCPVLSYCSTLMEAGRSEAQKRSDAVLT